MNSAEALASELKYAWEQYIHGKTEYKYICGQVDAICDLAELLDEEELADKITVIQRKLRWVKDNQDMFEYEIRRKLCEVEVK